MAEPLQFRAKAYGYDYTWEVLSPGLSVDAGGTPFVWCKPVQRHPGSKRGRLCRPVVFHLTYFTGEFVECMRAAWLRRLPRTEQPT